MSDPTVVTASETFERLACDANPTDRVPVEVRLPVADPFDAYRRARRPDERGGALLETTGGQFGWGYFGVDPVDRLTVSPDAVLRDREVGDRPYADPSPTLAALAGRLDGESLVRGDCDVPYPCGAFGWLSYDVARELESLPAETGDERGLPRLQIAVYDRLAAWEAPSDGTVTLRIVACPPAEAGYESGRARALDLADRIRTGDPDVGPPPVDAPAATFESECGREAFEDRVAAVKERIRAGDTFQTNISQRLVAPAAVHPVAAYDALRRVNPAPYSGLFEFPGVDLVSASPELLLDVEGDRVRTEPIAGTRPRGETDAEDGRLAEDLASDAKERAEHAMLVDLERNDLGKVCAYGSVAVDEYRRIDRYSEVMHLVSSVTGRLAETATLEDAVAATFPGGTITGAPKPETMAIADRVERSRRGPYTGSMGIFGFDGRATLNIVIRTLTRTADRYHLRVGAGVVHDSDPAAEYAETLDKARALVTAVDDALGAGELGVGTPDGGASEPQSEIGGDGS
jgi:anthranilate synthase component 1